MVDATVTLGWQADGARWADGARMHELVLGPVGLANLLGTRLALGGRSTERPVRISIWRTSIARLLATGSQVRLGQSGPDVDRTGPAVPHTSQASPNAFPPAPVDIEWLRASFRADPWGVARELLGWRDELVAAGWDAEPGSDLPPRLAVLAAIEALAGQHTSWAPGTPDLLRDVDRTLTHLVESASPWPIGITPLRVGHPTRLLPPIWQRILANLRALGTDVVEQPPPRPLASLTLLTSSSEWDAATTAARVLTTWGSTPHTALASSPTDLLDAELARRGQPVIGVRESTEQRPLGQIAELFLDAVTAPHDIQALARLLSHTLGATSGDTTTASAEPVHAPPARTGSRPLRLLPTSLSEAVIRALNEEPGVGGAAWATAIDEATAAQAASTNSAATSCSSAAPTPSAAPSLATEFDDLVRVHPLVADASGLPVTDVVDHLDWLSRRLAALARSAHSTDLSAAATQVRSVCEILPALGTHVSDHELREILAECSSSTPPTAGAEASALVDVATHPGQLGTGTAPVLWWMPVDNSPAPRRRWRHAELVWLHAHGVDVPEEEAAAALTLDAQLRALRRRGRVVAVLPPAASDDTDTPLHPALAFLLDDVRRTSDDDPESVADATERMSVPSDALYSADGTSWSLGDGPAMAGVAAIGTAPAAAPTLTPAATPTPAPAALPLTHLTPAEPPRPDPIERQIAPGTQLLPDSLSYSQWEKLLIHPLDWLLDRRLGVSPSRLGTVPTGPRMLGTWLHRGVQELVRQALATQGAPARVLPNSRAVRRVLEDLVPTHAAELDLPGRARTRATTLDQGTRAVTDLFLLLDRAGIRISGSEVPFTDGTNIPGTTTPGGGPIRLNGFRDLDVVLPDGRPGVIDLKDSRSKRKYTDLVAGGRALQLVVYAWSVCGTPIDEGRAVRVSAGAPGTTGDPRLSRVPVSYFSLRRGVLDTSFAEFGTETVLDVSPRDTGGATADELWARARRGLDSVLARLSQGRVVDIGNMASLPEWKELKRAWGSALRDGVPTREALGHVPTSLTQGQLDVLAETLDREFLPLEGAKYADHGRLTGVQEDML